MKSQTNVSRLGGKMEIKCLKNKDLSTQGPENPHTYTQALLLCLSDTHTHTRSHTSTRTHMCSQTRTHTHIQTNKVSLPLTEMACHVKFRFGKIFRDSGPPKRKKVTLFLKTNLKFVHGAGLLQERCLGRNKVGGGGWHHKLTF